MPIVRQVSIFSTNRPGVLAKLTRILGVAKINLLAISVPDSADQGILRVVPDDPGRLKSLLLQKGLSFSETKVLSVPMPNRPGALYDVTRRLKNARIDILYAYGSSARDGESANLIFHVSDLMKANRLLDGPGPG